MTNSNPRNAKHGCFIGLRSRRLRWLQKRALLYAVISLTIGSMLLSGCAIQYYDKETHTDHLWGFGHFKMKVAPPEEDVLATVKGSEVLGMSIKFAPEDSHFMVGWNETSQTTILDENSSLRLEWPTNDPFSIRVGSKPLLPSEWESERTQENLIKEE